jgi:aspartoacylase
MQTRIAINTLLDVLASARAGKLSLPKFLNVHRHLRSLEIPKDVAGNPLACLHPERLKGDWQEIKTGDPLFLNAAGNVEYFQSSQTEPVYTVFSNEAAYQEKNIALSLTCREKIRVTENWGPALKALLQG